MLLFTHKNFISVVGDDNMNLFIWYPKCSTCKSAKKYLEDKKVDLTLRDIITDNPSKEELSNWLNNSNYDIGKFFNTSGLIYKNNNLKEKRINMSIEEQLKLLSTNGMLVKRPILITNDKIIVGFDRKEYDKL